MAMTLCRERGCSGVDAATTQARLRGLDRMLALDCKDCSKTTEGLRALQHDVLESLARGKPIGVVMDRLCRHAEALAPGVVCSVLSVDRSGLLHTLAAPSLPQHYSVMIDNLAIGPNVGSCGACAWFGAPVESRDIATDSRWAEFKSMVLPLGLRACWSSPIHASDGRVIGTFAFYFPTCRGASEIELTIVATCVHLCALALEKEERNARIHRLAYYDSLTGAANRVGLERHGEMVVAKAIEKGARIALHCVDLDNFKEINDAFGHRAGDLLLKMVADRISARLSPGDIFARVGGDEFVVVQTDARSRACVRDYAAKIAEAVSAPFDLEDASVTIGVSIGVACAPRDGRDLSTLLQKGDIALYDAKGDGRGRLCFFDSEIEARAAADRRIRQELKQAIAGRQFEAHFQPMVDLAAGRVSGYEALIRWRHPGGKLLGPAEFLPVAEKAGLMNEIGEWTLRESCALAAARLSPETRVSVNLSPTQLEKPGFALDVARVIEASGLSPRRLELEITESSILVENAATMSCLQDIRRLGVSIALDDFGTGCSALSHLRAFPIDRIKIDRSFVQEAVERPETAAIVRTIIALARDLGAETTAEGVETKEQLRMLRRFGCDEIQGYLVSPPRSIDDLLMRERSALSRATPSSPAPALVEKTA
jgi:diguanylate cyclase (GGDEF)-like protein